MKSFDRLIAAFVLLAAVMFTVVNIIMLTPDSGGRPQNVEISRIVREIEDNGQAPDVSGYETTLGVYEQDSAGADFFISRNDYAIREINGRLYRIEYAVQEDHSEVLYVNVIMGVFTLLTAALLIYIRHSILKPFSRLSDLPYELAKGGLAVPLEESRRRYFGRFLWGLDMLREKLASSKQAELELQREKKTMLMSLSHDIKTPLSAIKLYSAALSKGIYTDPEKQRETAGSISAKADEIEQLVSEIMRSETEDIMHLEVNNVDFYLSDVIERIAVYYRDKLTDDVFTVGEYGNCILYGDADRLAEVLQNIIENAVKYGDGHYIHITFSDEEDCRLITITNTGCTLPDKELPHIFDSFWRGSNTGSQQGSGLGLYICRRLMELMGGSIYAEISSGCMNITAVCPKQT